MPDGPLVDTSVLIDFFGGVRTPQADRLDRLLADGPPPATAPVIVQEYLQGMRDRAAFAIAVEALTSFRRLDPPDYAIHQDAAELYRSLRCGGVTASTVDALIVAMAARDGCALLTRDPVQRSLARTAGVPLA